MHDSCTHVPDRACKTGRVKYLIVAAKMRPTMKMTAEDLDRLFIDAEPPTARRPDLAEAWARRMNEVSETLKK